jgi:allophanate hydrolase
MLPMAPAPKQPHSKNSQSSSARPSLAAQAWLLQLDTPLALSGDGALSGLRFAVKDNFDVQGLLTTAGCPGFSYQARSSAVAVQKLLQSGAALIGKTNLDQFACGLSGTRSPSGAVPNAFNPEYISGGSSSGSAYVVATGQADFALGTDTAGSGRVPAGLNNLVGLKPSKGLISNTGVVPAAQSLDCVSIFATSVGMAAQVLAQLQGYDAQDPYSRHLTLKAEPFPAEFRFGVPEPLEFFGDELARSSFEASSRRLESLGGRSVRIDFSALTEAASLLYESALVAERYAAIRPFFDDHEAQIIEPVRSIIAAGKRYSAADLFAAQQKLARLAQRASTIWAQIDVLLVPTAPTHYRIENMLADPIELNRRLGIYTNFVNLLDYAALAVPSSIRADGLPFGITLIAPAASDWQLAELGQRFHLAAAHNGALLQGATDKPLPAAQAIAGLQPAVTIRVAVVGAHLSGMPLNSQLLERGAVLVSKAVTAPNYRLFALRESTPPKPGLLRVGDGEGHCIEVEIWEMPSEHYGSFVALIASPLGIGVLQLADHGRVQGFVCEPQGLHDALDISEYGGWRNYLSAAPKKP